MLKNSKLQNLVKLSSKVTVYIPSTTDIDKPIDNTPYVDGVASKLSAMFGGATSTPALGMWVSPTAGLVKEHTTIVYAYCTDADLQEHIEQVIEICENLKTELKQDAISLEINGEMYFI